MMEELFSRSAGLWREGALAVHLRVRDRFRVAVDQHRQRSEDSDLSSTLQRWTLRFRRMFESRSSSTLRSSNYSKFYRKRVGKNIKAFNDSIIIQTLQALAMPLIGSACHVFMHGFNDIQVYGAEKLHQALLQRPEGKPLLTVSNHVASVDDPLVIASLLPPNALLDARSLRWTLCATDRCFRNSVLSTFFQCVKVLPVSRGDGIYQMGLDMAISKLNAGGWVHIFPEGSRSRDGGRTLGSIKRGVARLVMDSDTTPVVIPFVHSGMQDVMPIGASIPKFGKHVIVLVGDPIPFEDLLADKETAQHDSRGALYDAVSSRIGLHLRNLKSEIDLLASSPRPSDLREHNSQRASGIWQQVDWEAFGMEGVMPTRDTNLNNNPQIASSIHPDNGFLNPKAKYRRTVRVGLSFEGGIVSRIRGYMNPAELMGFAARGLVMSSRASNGCGGGEVAPRAL